MRKIAIATMAGVFTLSGLILPLSASAAGHAAGKAHKRNAVSSGPCSGLGIDLAVGSLNICIPL